MFMYIAHILLVLTCLGVISANEDTFTFIPDVKINMADGVYIENLSKIECALMCIGKEECTSYFTLNNVKQITTCVLRTSPQSPPEGTVVKKGIWVKRPIGLNKDCSDVFWNGEKGSGIYTVYTQHNGISEPMEVYCDMETDSGRWLIFQKRYNGSLSFNQRWRDFKDGFGDLKSEFWLGNRWLYRITSYSLYEMRVGLEDFEGNKVYATYAPFRISGKDRSYMLYLGNYTEGNAGDSLRLHDKSPFSTTDRDNDGHYKNLADYCGGGWWYPNSLPDANLNGYYGNDGTNAKGLIWSDFKGHTYSLKKSEMKIRPVL